MQPCEQFRGRITFAAISPLQPLPDANAVKQAQVELAKTVMAGLQLLPGRQVCQQHTANQHHGPLAWLQQHFRLPAVGAQKGNSSNASNQHSSMHAGGRRFPSHQRQEVADLTRINTGIVSPISSSSSNSSNDKCNNSNDKYNSSKPPPDRNQLRTRNHNENPASMPGLLCLEIDAGGRRRVYSIRRGIDSSNGGAWEGFDMVDDPETHQGRLLGLVRSYLLPQGFPDSVAPQYAGYMTWRGVQYFFGGAMSVFTTKSLLTSLGVAGRHSGEAAAAINWVLKDGAGRLGRFLFARWGRELDCELKQFRLAGDLLMEAGAALELSTILAPHAFLPLACSANLAKNLAAVAASSTRAPIYRTFALQNNLADITAKGESVANLADILGTLAGIMLSKWKLPMLPTFVCLSAGYLLASRKEVDSVELPYLNRARLAYTATKFLASGVVPDIQEANKNEPLLPWGRYHQGRVVLGSRVEAACTAPADLNHAAGLYKNEKYVLCYRPDSKKVHILLCQGAQPTDCLKAAFSAHVFLHMLDEEQGQASIFSNTLSSSSNSNTIHSVAASTSSNSSTSSHSAAVASAVAADSKGKSWLGRRKRSKKAADKADAKTAAATIPPTLTGADLVRDTWRKLAIALPWGGEPNNEYYRRLLERSKFAVDSLYIDFARQADKQGWKLASTMLNPKEARLITLQLTA